MAVQLNTIYPEPPVLATRRKSSATALSRIKQGGNSRSFWLAVVLSHALSAAYLLLFAFFHVAIGTQPYFKRQLAVQVNPTIVAALYTTLSAVHIWRVATIFRATLRRRALCFEYVPFQRQQRKQHLQQESTSAMSVSSESALSALLQASSPSLHTFARSVMRWWRKYLGRNGRFGIFGRHGDVRIWCVEYLNLGAHIFQAARWSRLWRSSTHCVVSALLCLECFVPAVYHIGSQRASDAQRARILLLDIGIDTLLCAVIPTWLVLPFMLHYVADPHVVNANYAETWYAEGVLTFKQSFATTLLDLATKVSPFWLNYLSLVEISSELQIPRLTPRSDDAADANVLGPRLSSIQPMPISVFGAAPRASGSCSNDVTTKTRWWWRCDSLKKRYVFWVLRLGVACLSVAFFVMMLDSFGLLNWGFYSVCHDDCLFETTPWFTSSCSCIVQEINCVKRNISSGGGPELEAELAAYEGGERLVVLILNNCHALVVPPTIRKFPNLIGIYIYASELVRWGDDAALTSNAFSSITYVVFVNTVVSAIPRGLLVNLAATVQDIEIIASPMPVTLPHDLHERWRSVGTLYIERCNLTAFPAQLLKMTTLQQLSLAGNAITELPDELFTSPLFQSLGYLILSANPALTHLPSHLDAAATTLRELYVDATSISALSLDRVAASSSLSVSAAQTPLCAGDALANSSVANTSTTSARVVCAGLYGGMYTLGVYPLLPEQRAERAMQILPSKALIASSSNSNRD